MARPDIARIGRATGTRLGRVVKTSLQYETERLIAEGHITEAASIFTFLGNVRDAFEAVIDTDELIGP